MGSIWYLPTHWMVTHVMSEEDFLGSRYENCVCLYCAPDYFAGLHTIVTAHHFNCYNKDLSCVFSEEMFCENCTRFAGLVTLINPGSYCMYCPTPFH